MPAHRSPHPNEHKRQLTAPNRYVRAQSRCSSRASLPLTPRLARLLQPLECALPLRSGQRQSQINDSFGLSGVSGNPTRPALPRGPTALKKLSQEKSVRELLQVGRAARRWQVLVGVRWQQFQCRVAAFYFQRVSLPVQWWRACGCPPQFRPRLPWWQPLVWRWLRLSGWLR